jgi:hypothetical protein
MKYSAMFAVPPFDHGWNCTGIRGIAIGTKSNGFHWCRHVVRIAIGQIRRCDLAEERQAGRAMKLLNLYTGSPFVEDLKVNLEIAMGFTQSTKDSRE